MVNKNVLNLQEYQKAGFNTKKAALDFIKKHNFKSQHNETIAHFRNRLKRTRIDVKMVSIASQKKQNLKNLLENHLKQKQFQYEKNERRRKTNELNKYDDYDSIKKLTLKE